MKTLVAVVVGLGACILASAAEQSGLAGIEKVEPAPAAVEKVAQPVAAFERLARAAALRADLAQRIITGMDKPETVAERLKSERSPVGLELDVRTERGLAAVDIGHRLVAAGRPEAGEVLFKAAEEAFGEALGALPERDSGGQKALIFEKRAQIRAEFLGKIDSAKADFDEALRLRPDDRRLQNLRDTVLNPRTQRKLGEQNN